MTNTRIFIADDHDVVRQGVSSVIRLEPGLEVCGEAADGRETVVKVLELKPDIVILDVAMPRLSAVECMRQILGELPATQFLIFTGRESEDLAGRLFAVGARAFVFKSDAAAALIPAIQALRVGKPFYGGSSSHEFFVDFLRKMTGPKPIPQDPLTPREREIVQLLAEGNSNKEIAAILGISIKTAETHRATLIKKMGFKSMIELVRFAVRNHLISE
jgi:DNA-binding NarL/FixJ family response regulator